MTTVLIFINKGYFGKTDISEQVYGWELSVLREIELNETMRGEIVNFIDVHIPVEDDSELFPADIEEKVSSKKPEYLDCKLKICFAERVCSLNTYTERDIYARAVVITATLQTYNPRQLKIFCWENLE